MVKCDGCGNFVKRSKAKSVLVGDKQRFSAVKAVPSFYGKSMK